MFLSNRQLYSSRELKTIFDSPAIWFSIVCACSKNEKKKLNKTYLNFVSISSIFLALVSFYAAGAQDIKQGYPTMAPIEQYLMDRNAEIALARSAAPASISNDAEVMVLGPHGFETAIKGKNGFVCIVERGWTSAPDPDFWNPKVRVPMCHNAASARSFLLRNLKKTELILKGHTKTQMMEAISVAIMRKELPPMESGAMCYMMSKEGYGGDLIPHWPSHLMFFFSDIIPQDWGANLPGSPILGLVDTSEHLTQFVIPTQLWSDGTKDTQASPLHHK
jgi:hypothetical protein